MLVAKLMAVILEQELRERGVRDISRDECERIARKMITGTIDEVSTALPDRPPVLH